MRWCNACKAYQPAETFGPQMNSCRVGANARRRRQYKPKPPRWDQEWPFKQKRLAYAAVHTAVKDGRLPVAKTLECVDCGGPAREYDHFKGYDVENKLNVQPVCRSCHMRREGGRVRR